MGLSRVAHRQFPWQTGYVNTAHLCRNIFVYGQGACADYFERTYGISINRFSFVSFALFASFLQSAYVTEDKILAQLGISKNELDSTLKLVAIPHRKARTEARELQHRVNHVAYMRSILRQTPCLMFGNQGQRIRAPLPELIIDRISSGLFYDIIKHNGSGDDFGPRFESYCLEYLRSVLPKFNWKTEHHYGAKKRRRSTPDILGKSEDLVQCVFECKARRMSHEAMFGRGPTQSDGVEDIGKGIRQIWTFYADTRKGMTGHTLHPNVFSAVITMDNWGIMGQAYIDRFFTEAERQMSERDVDVRPEDRRPVLIIPIQSLERALAKATQQSFLEAFALAQTAKGSSRDKRYIPRLRTTVMFFVAVDAVHHSLNTSKWSLAAFASVLQSFSSNSRQFGKLAARIRRSSGIPTKSGFIEAVLKPTYTMIRLFSDGP